MNWEVTWWMGLLVRAVVTIAVLAILFRLLRDKFTTARVSLTIGALVALGALWLANIEGASRLVFLGLEIDRRVESAQAILKRLEAVDKKASETTNQLIAIQTEASQTKEELNNLISREQRRFEIQRLEHAAINGDRKAYESLRDYQSEDSEFSDQPQLLTSRSSASTSGQRKSRG